MAKKYFLIAIVICSLLSSSLNAQFILYQRIFLTGVPSGLSPYLTPYTLDYNASVGGSTAGTCKPDTVNIRQYATSGLSSPGTPVNFDVELKSWPAYTTQAFTDSLNNFISIVQHFKAVNDQSPVSFYSVPPQQIFNNYNNVKSGFAPTAQAMLPLANAVDYFSPDFYTYGSSDTLGWRKAVDTTLAVIKKFYDTSKPVYPYISPADAPADTTTWLYELEYLYKHTKGALIWTGYTPNWNNNDPWWRCTKMFLVKKGLVPPLVIDSFNISPIAIAGKGLPVQWTTSSDTTSKYFVLQRSADSINFTPVSGQIYKLGYSYNLNQYRFTDTSIVAPTGKTIYYRLAITDINNNVSYSPLMNYTKSIYRSTGGNVSVDLYAAANWQEYNGTNWVAASSAPSNNLGRGDTVIVRPGDTWNAVSYESLPSGVVLIDSGFAGSFSYSFTNSGTISFSGSAQQVVPGSSILPYRTLNWGNFTINNASGVKCTEPSTDNIIHINSLSLNSGTFTVNADNGHAAGLYIDGPVSVGSGHIAVTASGLNKGVIVNGNTLQTLPSGTFLNNTISTLQLNNPQGVVYGGPLTISNKTELVRPASFTVSGNLGLDSLIIDTLKTTTAVSISGIATLAGALSIKSFASIPTAGQQFTLISASSITGSFASVTLPSGYNGTVNKVGNNLVLTMANIQTDSIVCIADAFVKSGSGNTTTNYGYNSYLAAYNGYYNAYLKFNLKTINGTVQNAQLRLYSLAGATTQWKVYKVNNNSWTEGGITWNTQPNGDTLLATITAPSSAGFVNWNITPQLQNIAADSTLSLEIIATAAAYSSFASRQGSAAQQPMIIYTTNISGGSMSPAIANTLKATGASVINIYPNPAKTSSIISSNETIKSINVYNAKGTLIRLVENINSKQYNISLNELPQGVYFIIINNNKSQQRKKLIKIN